MCHQWCEIALWWHYWSCPFCSAILPELPFCDWYGTTEAWRARVLITNFSVTLQKVHHMAHPLVLYSLKKYSNHFSKTPEPYFLFYLTITEAKSILVRAFLFSNLYCILGYFWGTKFSWFLRFLCLSRKLIPQKCCDATPLYVSTWVIRENYFPRKFNFGKTQKFSTLKITWYTVAKISLRNHSITELY